MESISANTRACRDRIAFYNMHVANSTHILHVIFVFFLHDDIRVIIMWILAFEAFVFDKLQEIADSIRVDTAISNYVTQLFVCVFWLQ